MTGQIAIEGDVMVRALGFLVNETSPTDSVMAAELVHDVGQLWAGTPVFVTMAQAVDGNRLVNDLFHGSETYDVSKCEIGARITLHDVKLGDNLRIDAGAYSVLDPRADVVMHQLRDPSTAFPKIGWSRPRLDGEPVEPKSAGRWTAQVKILGHCESPKIKEGSMVAVEFLEPTKGLHPYAVGDVAAVRFFSGAGTPLPLGDQIVAGVGYSPPCEIGARVLLVEPQYVNPWLVEARDFLILNPRSETDYDAIPDPDALDGLIPFETSWRRNRIHAEQSAPPEVLSAPQAAI